MAHIASAIYQLLNLGGAHWFCPRTSFYDETGFFEQDLSTSEIENETPEQKERRTKALEGYESRKIVVYQALQIFAFDGGNSAALLAQVKLHIQELMQSCFVCIRQYHKLRFELKLFLDNQHDEEDVLRFMDRVDSFNNDRIKVNLDCATNYFERLHEDDRKLNDLGKDPHKQAAVFAFFEAISSSAFCQNEQLVKTYFDKPFSLVKGVKRLITKAYLPAITVFLFCSHDDRRKWAEKIWGKIERNPTLEEYNWTVRDFLPLSLHGLEDRYYFPVFWNGMKTIMDKLDKHLIMHSFHHAIFCSTVHHMHIKFQGFMDLMAFTCRVLTIAPAAYWDALLVIDEANPVPIQPPVVIEQFFQSPNLHELLANGDLDALRHVFLFHKPLLESLSHKPSILARTFRLLVQSLMEIYHDESFPQDSRISAFDHAMYVISIIMNDLGTADLVRKEDMLQVVDQYSSELVRPTRSLKNTNAAESSKALGIIQDAINLECSLLHSTFHALIQPQPLPLKPQHLSGLSYGLSQKLPRILRSSDVALATYALIGAKQLATVEPIVSKKDSISSDAAKYNQALAITLRNISAILERMNDFDSRDMFSIFKNPYTASGLITALFQADETTRNKAFEFLESLNPDGEPGKEEAIRFLLKNFYLSTVTALADSISRVRIARLYQPLEAVLAVSKYVIASLCDSQDGLLRARILSNEEVEMTKQLWIALWQALMVIFGSTERWNKSYSRGTLDGFCRNVMQFAEKLFEHYRVLASAIDEDAQETIRMLLKWPSDAMTSMAQWLRLRDDYLKDTNTQLIISLLVKLRSVNLRISEGAEEFIEGVVSKKINANLSDGQIASLAQALDTHLGVTTNQSAIAAAAAASKVKVAKQSSITTFLGKDGNNVVKSDAETKSRPIGKMVLPLANNLMATKAEAARAAFVRERQAEKVAKLKAREERDKQRRGLGEAGSGLNDLCRIGKDHSINSSLMVASGSEDEDDESEDSDADELDRQLFGSPIKPKPSTKPKATPGQVSRLDLIALKEIKPVKLKRTQRSARDMRARIAPDLAPLHKVILAWDYFHQGDYPPGSQAEQYRKLPSKFANPVEYLDLFKPLLLLEAWQSFAKSREEGNSKPFEIRIATRSTVDALYEVSTLMPPKENQTREVGEGDVVLFSREKLASASSEHCLARVHKIQRSKKGLEVLYRISIGSSLGKTLVAGSLLWGLKIQSLTPLEREYGALQGLQYYDLCDYILQAQPSKILAYKDSVLEPISKAYELNKAQAKAVKSALDNDAFTLIQGPPGSGKTKTITAIVGALLSDSLNSSSVSGTAIRAPVSGGFGANTGNGSSHGDQVSKKLLVCAPSNAAVDELVMRFKKGVRTISGQLRQIKVVRLGRSDAVNVAVQDVTLEELVNAKLGISANGNDNRQDTQSLMMEHKEVSEKLRLARVNLEKENTKQSKDEFDEYRKKKAELSRLIDAAKEKENTSSRDADQSRKRVQQAILDGAHVICATLSGSGHEMFQNLNIEFETVVVDEAAQCVEASALIPLKYGCAKCILVGDPKQLPPTVLSKEATRFMYEQSLFVRIQMKAPEQVHLLDTQYRMHPEISRFPSQTFYDGRLLDGPDMEKLRVRPWHTASELLGPYRFFDVKGQHQAAPKGHSLINLAEIEVALCLYYRLTTDFESYGFKGKIGIITPYKSQLAELKARFKREYGQAIFENVEFNTTDAFQGRESEVIIFSCVRASPSGNIGFLQDIRRMNVGLTRAKSSLWVLGNEDSLMRGEFWRKLIEDAKKRGMFRSGSYLNELNRSTTQREDGNAVDGDGDLDMDRDNDGKMIQRKPSLHEQTRSHGSIKSVSKNNEPGQYDSMDIDGLVRVPSNLSAPSTITAVSASATSSKVSSRAPSRTQSPAMAHSTISSNRPAPLMMMKKPVGKVRKRVAGNGLIQPERPKKPKPKPKPEG